MDQPPHASPSLRPLLAPPARPGANPVAMPRPVYGSLADRSATPSSMAGLAPASPVHRRPASSTLAGAHTTRGTASLRGTLRSSSYLPPPETAPSLQQRFVVLLDTTVFGAVYVLADAAASVLYAVLYVVASKYTGGDRPAVIPPPSGSPPRTSFGGDDDACLNCMPRSLVVAEFATAIAILLIFLPRLLFSYPTETFASRFLRPGVVFTMLATFPVIALRGPWRWSGDHAVYDGLFALPPPDFGADAALPAVDTWAPVRQALSHLILLWPLRFLRVWWSAQRAFTLLTEHPAFVRPWSSSSATQASRHRWCGVRWTLRAPSQVACQILALITGVVCTLLVCAGMLHIIEFKYARDVRAGNDLSFFDAFFFTSLIATTISYDSALVPDAAFPRITILVIILVGIGFVPYGIAQVMYAVSLRNPWDARLVHDPHQHHVVVVGSGAALEAFTLRHFLAEFLAFSHGPAVMAAKVVILAPHDPPPRTVRVLREPAFRHRVQWIRGSALSVDSLVGRADVRRARACFVLARKFADSSRAVDAENVLRAMALAAASPAPIYVQCLLPDTRRHFAHFADTVLCVDTLKLAVLARSALCPGFSTLVYLLSTTIAVPPPPAQAHIPHRDHNGYNSGMSAAAIEAAGGHAEGGSDADNERAAWDDFAHSANVGLYPVVPHASAEGHTFASVAAHWYHDLGLVLLGLSGDGGHPDDDVVLAPMAWVMSGSEVAYVLALSEPHAARAAAHVLPRRPVSVVPPVPSIPPHWPAINVVPLVPSPSSTPILAPTPVHPSPLGIPTAASGPRIQTPPRLATDATPASTTAASVAQGTSLAAVDFPSFQYALHRRRSRMVSAGGASASPDGQDLAALRRNLTRPSRALPSGGAAGAGLSLQRFHTIDFSGRRGQQQRGDADEDDDEEEEDDDETTPTATTTTSTATKALRLLRRLQRGRKPAPPPPSSRRTAGNGAVTDGELAAYAEEDEYGEEELPLLSSSLGPFQQRPPWESAAAEPLPPRPAPPRSRATFTDDEDPATLVPGAASLSVSPVSGYMRQHSPPAPAKQASVFATPTPRARTVSSSGTALPALAHRRAPTPPFRPTPSSPLIAPTVVHSPPPPPPSAPPVVPPPRSPFTPSPLPRMSVLTSLDDEIECKFTDHILICAPSSASSGAAATFPANLECFLHPLAQSRHAPVSPALIAAPMGPPAPARIPVVVLCEAAPSRGEWARLTDAYGGTGEKLQYVVGSPLVIRDLLRAGAARASRAIVLADETAVVAASASRAAAGGGGGGEKTEDANAMMTVFNLKTVCPANTFIVAEFVHNETMRFLTEQDVSPDNASEVLDAANALAAGESIPHRSPSFMAGNVFTVSMLDSLVAQSYYAPHLVRVLRQLLHIDDPWVENVAPPPGAASWYPSEDGHPDVVQEPVPAELAGRTFRDAFPWWLRERKAVPLAIYRLARGFRRVIMAPPPATVVQAEDRVFLLATAGAVVGNGLVESPADV
ncbi:potassium channel, sub T, member 2 [Blastocladiella emersonii ATCC 22665]|nr:potassium channel, sub T, member 2 [Blastocladiella emersonii ATCC 22665]